MIPVGTAPGPGMSGWRRALRMRPRSITSRLAEAGWTNSRATNRMGGRLEQRLTGSRARILRISALIAGFEVVLSQIGRRRPLAAPRQRSDLRCAHRTSWLRDQFPGVCLCRDRAANSGAQSRASQPAWTCGHQTMGPSTGSARTSLGGRQPSAPTAWRLWRTTAARRPCECERGKENGHRSSSVTVTVNIGLVIRASNPFARQPAARRVDVSLAVACICPFLSPGTGGAIAILGGTPYLRAAEHGREASGSAARSGKVSKRGAAPEVRLRRALVPAGKPPPAPHASAGR